MCVLVGGCEKGKSYFSKIFYERRCGDESIRRLFIEWGVVLGVRMEVVLWVVW